LVAGALPGGDELVLDDVTDGRRLGVLGVAETFGVEHQGRRFVVAAGVDPGAQRVTVDFGSGPQPAEILARGVWIGDAVALVDGLTVQVTFDHGDGHARFTGRRPVTAQTLDAAGPVGYAPG
jgi:hypothetical protein